MFPLNWKIIPTLFHFLSPFNRLEIETVISYVKQLLSSEERSIVEHDIGIISPYRKQSEEIKSKCNANGWKNIKTGAVEVFQGQERPIIIVSLVKSNTKSIGFLDNPKVSDDIPIKLSFVLFFI